PKRSRVEFVETDGIVAVLVFGPGDRWFGNNACDFVADAAGARMQREFWNRCADCEQAERHTMAPEVAITSKRANDEVEGKHCAQAMADDHDFIHLRVTHA